MLVTKGYRFNSYWQYYFFSSDIRLVVYLSKKKWMTKNIGLGLTPTLLSFVETGPLGFLLAI